jgi:hypothetical protein
MIQWRTSEQAMPGRRPVKSGTGEAHWRTEFLGPHPQGSPLPQAFLIEMTPDEVILPHFHEVDQFQVFIAGTGTLGRQHGGMHPIVIHYVDRYTGYGPIAAGAQGFSYFALRAQTDPGAIYLHRPGYRERLRPSRKRHYTVQLTPSTEPVLLSRAGVKEEALFEDEAGSEAGVSARVLRMGPGTSASIPNPAFGGGQYLLVLQGCLEHGEFSLPAWSVIFVTPDEAPLDALAGTQGLELLVLQYPRQVPGHEGP